MASCDTELPEPTVGRSSGRPPGAGAARTWRCSTTKRTVASGLEALARLLARAAAAEVDASFPTDVEQPVVDSKS